MVILSSVLSEDSILIRIHCQTNLFYTQDIDEDFNLFRVLLIDSGFLFKFSIKYLFNT